jgi:hypothetical protein
MWGLTPVRSFSVSSFSWSHIFKAASSHREAGSLTCKIDLADAASHSRSHPSSSTSQYSSTALVVPSSPALNVSRKCSIIDILITDLYAFLSRSQVLANDHSVEGHRSSEKSAEHAASAPA